MHVRAFLLLASILTLASCSEGAGPAVSSPASPVTQANLLGSERYWPYRVGLREAWQAPGRDEPLPPRLVGVLIRVEPSGLPRIDFGRLGKYEVPLGKTDLLERANQIRMGSEEKAEPNFVHAIKSRLLDSASDALRPLPIQEAERRQGFLCVFADPAAPDFAELARTLAPLRERHRVMTILFPQGEHPDVSLRDRLRELGWPVPFLPDFLAEPYTRTLLSEGTRIPLVMLQTNEGRVLVQARGSAQVAVELEGVLDQTFGS